MTMIRKMTAALLAATLLVGLTASTALAARPFVVLTTVMTGAAEVPGPGDPNAFGVAAILVVPRTDKVCWAVTWNRVDGTVHMAHIHGPATVDEAGPIRVILFMDRAFAGRGAHAGCTVSAEWADAIAADPGQFYVNVHSTPDFGPGAIRGQLH
jgi:hypothetical protein